jgi:signal transduction histidine kinase
MAASMMPVAKEKGVVISVAPAEAEEVAVRADRTRLVQVLTNLISNAIKYNRPDGTVTLSAEPYESDWIRITVADTGIGIPEAQHDAVFQPFNRVGAEGGSIEGTGIGLTICQRLIVQMGGRIGFESEPGRGSRFWILVPRAGGEGPFWRDPAPLGDGETG